uniref:Uncharacterized protein n=1 Tax=Amphimedon queenslandica TaxID=400682 RepID=A0A1X7UEK2_AMPQE
QIVILHTSYSYSNDSILTQSVKVFQYFIPSSMIHHLTL